MKKLNIQTQFFRNPLFILGCYVLLLLPEFVNVCNDSEVFLSFWNNIPICSKEFVFTTFFVNSIWSLILLVFVFETYKIICCHLKINEFPVGKIEWLRFQSNLMIVAGLSFSIYLLFTYLFKRNDNSLEEVKVLSMFYKTVFVTYFGINGLLLLSFIKHIRHPLSQKIEVKSFLGKIPIALNDIVFFEKVGRNYFANSMEENFRIETNLSKLEKSLSMKHFARINRSVIVNISDIKSYSHWENEKYILLLKTGKEFVVTRERLVELKKVLSLK